MRDDFDDVVNDGANTCGAEPWPHLTAARCCCWLCSHRSFDTPSMGSELHAAAVRVGKPRKTCSDWPFVTVHEARQRHARTPAPCVHAGTGEKLLL